MGVTDIHQISHELKWWTVSHHDACDLKEQMKFIQNLYTCITLHLENKDD